MTSTLTMKSREQVRAELRKVRKLLAARSVEDEGHAMLYGAQQSLIWMLHEGMAPSTVEAEIHKITEKYFYEGKGAP